MRVFSDEEFEVGRRLGLDILMANGESVRCWGEIVWVQPLDHGAPAKWDIGLKFTDMEPSDIQRLASVLGPAR
jgi:hypothetical protein